MTPRELAARFDHVRRWAREAGRDPERIRLSCCRPIELTPEPVLPQEDDRLMGSPEQLIVALRAYGKIGVEHMALQFMVSRWPERREQIEISSPRPTPSPGYPDSRRSSPRSWPPSAHLQDPDH